MKILNREIKAAILDMDGTLIDSVGIWADIDKDFFHKRGMEIPEFYAKEIVHLGLKDGAKMTVDNYCPNEKPEDIIKEWRDSSIEYYTHKIPLKSGALELLNYLKNNNVKLSIATANDKELYEPCLKRLGIRDYFDIIIDVNSVDEGKSSPKIYNLVSEKLGVNPENVIVFEDSVTPLITAFNNGYLTVAVYDKYSEKYDEQKRVNSHIYIRSLDELIK